MNLLTETPIAALLAVAALGILLAALLSAAEVAVLGASRASVAKLADRKPQLADRLSFLTHNAAESAALAGFARLFFEMLATACITVSLATAFDEWWLVVTLSVVVSTIISLVLVRISPRTIGRHNPAQVLGGLSGLLYAVTKMFMWVVPMTRGARVPPIVDDAHELKMFVDRVEESDVIEDDERDMLRSVIELHETKVREVMVPRTDMISIEAAVPLHKAQNLFVRSGFSRVPVVGESSDEVLGVLFFKDAARVLLNSHDPDSKTVADVMRTIQFYPETKMADELLREMQATHQHIAMVIDEYGGIAGMVTVEDILEEIVGELVDEHDNETPGITKISENAYRVPARLPLDELGALFNRELDDPDVDTVAGLLSKLIGRVPLARSSAVTQGIRLSAHEFGGRRKQLSSVIAELIEDESPATSGEASSSNTQGAGDTPPDPRETARAQHEEKLP